MRLFVASAGPYNHAQATTTLHRWCGGAFMFRHYVSVALRNIRTSPFTSAVNVLTLAVGLVCFVTAYAAGTFWSSAEQHFRNRDNIHVLTLSVKSRDTGSGSAPRQQLRGGTYAPDV